MTKRKKTPAINKKRGRPQVPYTLIQAGLVLTPDHEIHKGSILIHGRRIIAVGRAAEIDAAVRSRHDRSGRFEMDVIDAADLIAVPGFIDIHQHGGGGADYMDGTPEAVRTILQTHGRSGTTAIVPTLMTGSRPATRRALAALDTVRPRRMRGSVSAAEPVGPEILGVHLEGPFISRVKHGAQPASAIRKINEAEIREYLKSFRIPIRIVTLAPELPGAPAFIKFLVRRGIVAAAGHSDADFDQAIRGFDAGITHGTHLFNAMRGFGHREPGVAGALLLNEHASVELIADLRPDLVRQTGCRGSRHGPAAVDDFPGKHDHNEDRSPCGSRLKCYTSGTGEQKGARLSETTLTSQLTAVSRLTPAWCDPFARNNVTDVGDERESEGNSLSLNFHN